MQRLHAAGYVLGVLSDSEDTPPRIQQRLARLGMGECFDTVVSSVTLGRTKPDPECYHAALAAIRLSPGDVIFVGHDAEELDGAAAVGMRTMAFNYEDDAEADAYLDRFDDLPGYLVPPGGYAAAG